jgi:hypothetical protein
MKKTKIEIQKRKMKQKIMVKIEKSKSQLRKSKKENDKFDRLNGRLKTELKMIKLRLKRTNKQLRLLSKKEEFLLDSISSLKKHKKENKNLMSIAREIIRRLK